MKNFIPLLISLVFFIQIVPAYSEFDEGINLRTGVDSNSVHLGETLTFNVIVTGKFKTNPQVVLPEMEDFELISSGRSQNVTIKEGQTSLSVEYNYLIRPKTKGKLIIGPCKLIFKNKVFETMPIEVEVLDALPDSQLPAQGNKMPKFETEGTLL